MAKKYMPYDLERAIPKIGLTVILSTKQSIREEVLVEIKRGIS